MHKINYLGKHNKTPFTLNKLVIFTNLALMLLVIWQIKLFLKQYLRNKHFEVGAKIFM